jgi:hypothetical protein
MRLVRIIHSSNPAKKFTAIFQNEEHTKKVNFGSKGMDDYTITHDKEQRERYRQRHEKDLSTHDPTRAGFLSYYLLWGNSTSLHANIAAYKRKFHL